MTDTLDPIVDALYRRDRSLVEVVPFEVVVAWPDDALADAWRASRSAQNVFDVALVYAPMRGLVKTALRHLDTEGDPFQHILDGAVASLRTAVDEDPAEALRAYEDADALVTTADVMQLTETRSRAAIVMSLAQLVLKRPAPALVWNHLNGLNRLSMHPQPGFLSRAAADIRRSVSVPTWALITAHLGPR